MDTYWKNEFVIRQANADPPDPPKWYEDEEDDSYPSAQEDVDQEDYYEKKYGRINK